jgi:hypothetical protein
MKCQVLASTLIAVLAAVGSQYGIAQQAIRTDNPDTAETLRKGQIVAGNIQTAITGHILDDPGFRQNKQLPEDPQNHPKILVFKDGSFIFDWTPGQEARYLMEELRQGIHILQSVDKPHGMDIIALTGAREYWPKLRDISCGENPGIRYYDLDGFEEYCPAK